MFNQIKEALAWQIDLPDWKQKNDQFIPYGSTYLNNHRWEDEPTMHVESNELEYMQGVQ